MRFIRSCTCCNLIVWPGTQSIISFSPIHLACHQKDISDKLFYNPELKSMYDRQIMGHFFRTGKDPKLRVNPENNVNISDMILSGNVYVRELQFFIYSLPSMSFWFLGILAFVFYLLIHGLMPS